MCVIMSSFYLTARFLCVWGADFDSNFLSPSVFFPISNFPPLRALIKFPSTFFSLHLSFFEFHWLFHNVHFFSIIFAFLQLFSSFLAPRYIKAMEPLLTSEIQLYQDKLIGKVSRLLRLRLREVLNYLLSIFRNGNPMWRVSLRKML